MVNSPNTRTSPWDVPMAINEDMAWKTNKKDINVITLN